MKQDNVMEQSLEAQSCNSDDNYYYSSTISLCRYFVESYEDEFITPTGDSGLIFSGQISPVETASIMSDIGLNLSQLHILLRILQNKLSTKVFESENMMKSLSGDMIIPKFGEYNYYHESGSKLELILFWVRDTVAGLKKETQLLIDSGDVDVYEINTIDVVVGGNHGQGSFRFSMTFLYITNNGKIHAVYNLWVT